MTIPACVINTSLEFYGIILSFFIPLARCGVLLELSCSVCGGHSGDLIIVILLITLFLSISPILYLSFDCFMFLSPRFLYPNMFNFRLCSGRGGLVNDACAIFFLKDPFHFNSSSYVIFINVERTVLLLINLMTFSQQEIINVFFRYYVPMFGLPSIIFTDRHFCFQGEIFSNFISNHHISHEYYD